MEAKAAGDGLAGSPPLAAPRQQHGKFNFSTDLIQTNKVYPPKKPYSNNICLEKESLAELGRSIPPA